jgi:hypothetical protein
VVDARDGRPIQGAVVELWTEEGVKPHVASAQLATLRTDADGASTFQYEIDGRRADAARVARAGYGSVSVSTSDLEDGVKLWPAVPFAGRVVDLDGRPVADALVRSEPGPCRHAVPGTQVRTAADGSFRCDDLPENAVLQVIPREHVPLGNVPLITLRRVAARDGSVDIHVVQRAPTRVRFLDEHGQPLARRRVHQNFEDVFVSTWTDDAGLALLPPPERLDAQISVFDGADEKNLDPFVPRGGEFARKPLQMQHAGGAGRLTIDVRAPARSEDVPKPVLATADGSTWWDANPAGVATGPATVYVGADFSPWAERSVHVEVTPEPRTVVVEAARAPLVRVLVPDFAAAVAWIHVQAGPTGASALDDGATLGATREFRLHVPDAQPLHVMVVGFDGEIRAGRLAPLAPDLEVELDLRPAMCILRAGVPEPAAIDAHGDEGGKSPR